MKEVCPLQIGTHFFLFTVIGAHSFLTNHKGETFGNKIDKKDRVSNVFLK